MQAVAEQRHAPRLHVALEDRHGAQRVIGAHLEHAAALRGLHPARRSLGHQLAGDHESQPIALLGLFEIVRGDEDRRAVVGELVDHRPEGAARNRVHAGGRLVQKQHARLVHDGRAEGHALLPATGQTSRELSALALEAGELEHPALARLADLARHLVDAREKVEVLVDREVVVERELLGHVAELLADVLGAQLTDLARQAHLARARFQQAAEHLDGGRLARAVGAEQAVDLAVTDLQVDALDRLEVAEGLTQDARADGDLVVACLVGAALGKRRHVRLALQRAQDRHERVLERGRRGADAAQRVAERLADRALPGARVAHQDVEPIAEALHVGDAVPAAEGRLRPAQVRGAHLESLEPQSLTQLGRCPRSMQAAVVHQCHAMASLGLVQVRRRKQDRHPLRRQLGERVPELAPRDRIDARRRLIEQQDARLRHQRAGQRELLLHAAAQPPREPVGEALHPEHREVPLAARADVAQRDASQLTDVAEVLGHAEIRVEAERLGEIADVLACLPCGAAEQLRVARGGFHHAAEDLERRGLARAVGPDEPEDLAPAHVQFDAAHRLDLAVALGQRARADGGVAVIHARVGLAHRRVYPVGHL